MFPLPSMDSRISVQHMNTFMKNTLIRGLNNVYETAPVVKNGRLMDTFLRYTLMVCDMLRLHLEGDQTFLTSRNAYGKSVVDFLSKADSFEIESSALHKSLKGMQQNLQSWNKAPETYSYRDLRSSLESLSILMLRSMKIQRKALNKEFLMMFFAEGELRDMITDNLNWLALHSDMSILLPFVLSHHDPATSAQWPTVAHEGLKLVPDFVGKDPTCWDFAPVDPITKQKRISRCERLSIC